MSRAPVADSPHALGPAPVKDVHALPENQLDISRQPAESASAGSPGVARTYRGRTMEELIPRIQRELGSDPIILRRREGLAGGLAGFFQRPFVEIEATPSGPRIDLYDEEEAPTRRKAQTKGAPAQPRTPAPFYSREPVAPSAESVTERLAALSRAGPPRSEPARPPLTRRPAAEFQELAPIDFSDTLASALKDAHVGAAPHPAPAAQRREWTPRGRMQVNIQKKLLSFGISEQFAEELIEVAVAHVLPFAPRAGLLAAVQSALAQRIPVAPSLPARGAAITLVGPGGAGKTSCCAALLGAYRKSALLPANCATLIRGAERGELQMLMSPHVMKPTPIESTRAKRALSKGRGEGLLVIDTPSLSPGDRSGIRELSALLGELACERVLVALPATLGATAAAQLLQALQPLGASVLAVTHADETDQLGVVVEAACRFGLAPEYTLDRARAGGWRLSRVDPTGLAAKLLQ
jgi:flagellar biosynthesis protein FlhF